MPAQVTISATALPDTLWEGDLQALLELFAAHLEGTFSGNVLVGQTGGSAPSSDVGLWVNGNIVYSWNSTAGRYLPMPLAIGRVHTGGVLTLTKFFSTATADRTLYTPDKDGTIAITEDIFGEVATSTITGTTPSLDWNVEAKNYYLVLGGATTLTSTNAADGQERHLFVENPASASHTFAMSDVIWANGSGPAPTQSVGGANYRAVDHYVLKVIGDRIFANRIGADFRISTLGGSGGDVSAPVADDIQHTGSGNVYVDFNELLQGGTIASGDWTVKKNGTNQGITSVTVSGQRVTIDTATTFTSSNTVTVQYTGSTVKDLAGNAAAAFGPSASTYISSVPPIGGGGNGDQNEP